MTYNAVLSHQSALVFYLCVNEFEVLKPYREGFDKLLPSHAPSAHSVKLYRRIMNALPFSGNTFIDEAKHAPLQFAVTQRNGVHHTKDQCTHVIGKDLQDGSILWLKGSFGSLTIISPELCFLLAAQYASMHELIYLGNLLCSNFSFIYGHSLMTLGTRAAPLTTPGKISDYIDKAANIQGRSIAKRAAQYLLAGALSPRECMLSMFFRLPQRLGGLGLSNVTLNTQVSLIDPKTTNWIRLRPDFLFKNDHNGLSVALEYNSDEHHSGKEPLFRDARRMEIFEANGYKTLSIETSDCYELELLNKRAYHIYELLDQKRPRNLKSKTYSDGTTMEVMRSRLYHYLFDNFAQLKCLIPPKHRYYEPKCVRHTGKRLTLVN